MDNMSPILHSNELEAELTAAREELAEKEDCIDNWMEKAMRFKKQRDRLAAALENCREDSIELLGERDWWQLENRGDYQQRYQTTRDNVTHADAALQSLDQPEQNNMKPEQNNMNTPTPSPYATDGQRTTDAECWMNYCLEAEKELTAAREELETERIRLAACGVVAMADTKGSRTKAREMLPEYRSASLSDVERRVDECIELREQRDRLAESIQKYLSEDYPAAILQQALQSLNQNDKDLARRALDSE